MTASIHLLSDARMLREAREALGALRWAAVAAARRPWWVSDPHDELHAAGAAFYGPATEPALCRAALAYAKWRRGQEPHDDDLARAAVRYAVAVAAPFGEEDGHGS
jgi:hypothetical protein